MSASKRALPKMSKSPEKCPLFAQITTDIPRDQENLRVPDLQGRYEYDRRAGGAAPRTQVRAQSCNGYLDHPFLKNKTPEENSQALC
jgi:hypothetical protein